MIAIRFGLAAIKGCGEGAAAALVESRTKTGPFKSLYDTCYRADSAFNKGVLHSLAGAGALDCWGVERAALCELYETVQVRIKADKKVEKKAGGTPALFDLSHEAMPLAIPDVPAWSEEERLRQEKEAIGFYQSGHPLKKYSAVLDKAKRLSIVQLGMMEADTPVRVAGLITGLREHRDKKGNTMCFMSLEDETESCDAVVFSKTWEVLSKNPPSIGDPVLVSGRISKREGYDSSVAVNTVQQLVAEQRGLL